MGEQQLNRRTYLLIALSAILASSTLFVAPTSLVNVAGTPTAPTSWNPKVPCAPLIVRISDINANQTGSASFSSSPFAPGITTTVQNGEAKRWLTRGPIPPGWVPPGPPCTVTNSKGTTSLFVQINGVERNTLVNEDYSTTYDPANGAAGHANTTDTTFNLFDPGVVSNYSRSCTSPSDPTCSGRIHAEIDHDWKAAGYCGPGTVCDNATLASQSSPDLTRIDVQGFIFWDPDNLNATWHDFNGWEIHPLTAWRLSSTVNFSWSPTNPQVGGTVVFTATVSNGTTPSGFSWDFGDGVTASGSSDSHIFVTSQVFSVQVTMTDTQGITASAQRAVPVGSWSPAVSCSPTLTTLEGIVGNVSIQRIPENTNSTGADYSGGGFKIDGNLPYGSNPATWPFFKRDLRPPCSVNGTPAFVEFHNVTVTDVNMGNCGTTYSIDNGGGSYPNGWQSCDTTFNLFTPGFGDAPTCPNCYMHRVYAGIDRDWNASGVAPLPRPAEGQRIDVQGFIFWNNAIVNASWHSFSGWEIHPFAAWRSTRPSVTASASFSPSNPTTGQTVIFNGTASGGTGPYTFNWDFGDGTVTSGNPASRTYPSGTYIVHVAATDSVGTIGVASLTVTAVGIPPDFSISINPATLNLSAGASSNTTVNLSSFAEFNGNVSLTELGPSGIGASLTPTNIVLPSGGSATSTLTLSTSTAGNYTVTVTGTSGSLSHSANLAVKVTDVGPAASFTESATTAPTGAYITLSISASDPDGTVTAIRVVWGDGTIDSLAGTATSDSHSYALAGSYTVYVNATDNANLTTKSNVAIETITDRPPVVSFSESATTAPTGTPITLTIFVSDPDGTVTSLKVSWGDGTVDSLSSTTTIDSHSYALAGSYTVYVNATDNTGLTAKSNPATKTITDRPPTVSFTESTTTAPTGTSISLTITAADPDGTVSSLNVVWGDGTIGSLAGSATSDSHAYSVAGTYQVYVNTTDNSGSTTKSAVATKTITDRPPTVSFTESVTTASTGTSITLTITAADPDGTVSTLKVSWGDGTLDTLAGSATTDSHAYSSTENAPSATFTVYVNATDNSDSTTKSSTATKTVNDRPPTVSFTESDSTVPTGTSITLTLTAADPDGTVVGLEVSWGDGTVDAQAGSATSDSHAYSVAGAYQVYANATDNSGSTTKSSVATKTVTDRPPTVSFSESASTAPTGTSITLTIPVTDPDGNVTSITVSWGDETVDSLTGTATSGSHSYAQAGSYTVYVNATDNANLTTKSAVSVMTITDRAPTVTFTESASTLSTDTPITLAISASDPDGTVSTINVSWGDGMVDSLPGSATADSHSYSVAGSYTVYVNATDNANLTTKSFTTTNTISDRPPVVSFVDSATTIATGTPITLTISASDPDGTVTAIKVVWGDGLIDNLSGTSTSDSHLYAVAGSYTVYVNATDDSGSTTKSSTSTKTITDRPPTVSFTESATTDPTGTSITLTITAADPDGTVSNLKVVWGDDTIDMLAGTATTDSHAYNSTGNAQSAAFNVYVNATDNSGSTMKSSTATNTITDKAPIVGFTESATTAPTGTSITLTISASDSDGTVSSLKVVWGDGAFDSLAGSATSDSHTYSVAGSYHVYVNATDNSGSTTNSAVATKTITDQPPTVSFTESATTVPTGTNITLTISSTDLDGTVTSIKVVWVDGTIDNLAGTATSDSHSYALAGSYNVYVNATDNANLTTQSAVAVNRITDRPPTVSFTESASTVPTSTPITLPISTNDPDGTVSTINVSWGDGTVDSLPGTTTSDSHSYSLAGSYSVYVNATDNANLTTQSTVALKTITDRPATIGFTESATTVSTGTPITLTISASDPDGTVTSLKVVWGDGTIDTLAGTATTDSHAYASTGNAPSATFSVYANATDNSGSTTQSSIATKTIIDMAPTVSFTESATTAPTGTSIGLTMTSVDLDGTVSSLKVSWGDGTVDILAGNATSDSHTYTNTGNALSEAFTVYVNATDNAGSTTQSPTATDTIIDREPVVSFIESASTAPTGTSITLTISAADPDGTITGINVVWGDGTVDTLAGTATTDSHSYAVAESYQVYVNATDNSGSVTESATATKTITDRPPTISFTQSATTVSTGTALTLTITSADPDGTVSAINVSWGDGTVDSLLGSATIDSHTYVSTGNALSSTFSIYMNASDNSGSTTQSNTVTETITDRVPNVSFTESTTTATAGQMITLTITSADPDGSMSSLKVVWGDGTIDTLPGTATTDSHVYANTGNALSQTFNVYVNATDNSGSTSQSSISTVTIQDLPPTVNFAESATVMHTGTPVTLTITSADPDGSVSSLSVVWGDGTIDTLSGTDTFDSHSYSTSGTFSAYVNATDNSGSTTQSAVATNTIQGDISVSFTENTTTATTGQTISMTISASEPSGTIASINVVWGDGTIDTLPGTATSDSHAYSSTGNSPTATFQVYANATDNLGRTQKSQVATNTISDRAPTVSFTESATSAPTGTSITLTITLADPDGTVAGFKVVWGDGTVDTLARTATSDSHSYASTGSSQTATFTVYVNATDNSGVTTQSSTATKTISDRPPTVSFTESATTANTGQTISLKVTAADPDGTFSSLKVVWGDGTIDTLPGTAATYSHAYSSTGSSPTATFQVYVNATDNSGSATKSALATKTISDRAPSASLTESATSAPTGTPITLTISSADPDGTVTSINIVWSDGTVDILPGTSTIDSHSYSLAGSYNIYVNSTDDANLTTQSTPSTVTITDRPPTVSFTESATTVPTDTPLTLTISASDPDGTVASLKVSWGDGTVDSLAGTATSDTHSYALAGSYTVHVNATDNANLTLQSASATKSVTDRPPTVSFTESATTVPTGIPITLTITAADPDGSVTSIKVVWGDGTVDNLAGTATSDSHSYALAGSDKVYVNATDDAGLTTTSAIAVKTIIDRAPTATFTESASTIPTGTSITLTISASDPDGTVNSIRVSWGDGTVDSLPGSASTDSHSYSMAGSYSVYVNATDNANLTTQSTVATKTITDRPPTVSFTEPTTTVPTGTTITLTISSADPDGIVTGLKVVWGDGTIDNLAGWSTSDSHSYYFAGDYTVYVNATDDANLTTMSTMAVKTITDRGPLVSFTESSTVVPTGTPITLTISASDPDGTVSTLKVFWGDGTVDSLAGIVTSDSHSYALAGSYSVYVNATDNANLTTKSTTASKTIVDKPPIVSFTESATTVPTGTSITLTINASDPDGRVTSIKVSWGDGAIDSLAGTAASDSHSYSQAGLYIVYANATDDANLTTKSTTAIKAITDRPATLTFTESASTIPTGTPITLTISSTDPDGIVTGLKVVWGDGTIDSLAGTATSDSHSYVFAGSYTVYVNATDNAYLTTKSSVAVKTLTDRPPLVSFTESSTVVPTGSAITLTITTSDPDGTVSALKVSWGDGTVDNLPGTDTSDSHSYAVAGSYTVYVNATDNANLTTKSSTSIKTVTDRPPTVSFTESATTAPTGTPITLIITAADPDGTVSSLKVVWGDGAIDSLAGSANSDGHAYSVAGTYQVYVNATDNSGSITKSPTSTKTITDRPPTISFTESATSALTGTPITLTISTADPDGTVTSLRVVWGDGTIDTLAGTSTIDSHAYTSTGNSQSATFTVYVNATDNSGSTTKSSTSTKTINHTPPTVSFNNSATTAPTGAPISLTISAVDPYGTITGIKVVWGDGTIDSLAGTVTYDNHSYSLAGSYPVYANATDNANLTVKSAVSMDTIIDRAPSVSFTESASTVPTSTTITLTISANDPDGTVSSLKVSWGDGMVDTLPGSATSDSHSYSLASSYSVYVNATDNANLTSKSDVAVKTIIDRPPTISFTEFATTVSTGTPITLTISTSDLDGTVTSLKVSWGDGTVHSLTGTTTSDSHSYTLAGSYEVYANATDNANLTTKSTTATETITDRHPIVSFTESATTVPSETTITLTISSTDPDGTLTGLKVVWGDGTIDNLASTATSAGHSFSLAGSYAVYLNATDNAGLTTQSSISTKTITDRPPVAVLYKTTTSALTGDVVGFGASASTDPDGGITGYAWNFGDGITGSGAGISHSYAAPGTYTVILTVTDNSGNTNTATTTMTIGVRAPAAFTLAPDTMLLLLLILLAAALLLLGASGRARRSGSASPSAQTRTG